ncbi:hypothetical protein BDZ45DRAFT_752975 [Acephala macrosclerotiorum]|nr:hypothetical protein BDZ45DRAFT_752975 [Acephala macrosclerotiorum]
MPRSKLAARTRTVGRSLPKSVGSAGSTPETITSAKPDGKVDPLKARISLWLIDTQLAKLAAETEHLKTRRNDLRMVLRDIPDLVLQTSSQSSSTRRSEFQFIADESDSATLSDCTAISDDDEILKCTLRRLLSMLSGELEGWNMVKREMVKGEMVKGEMKEALASGVKMRAQLRFPCFWRFEGQGM